MTVRLSVFLLCSALEEFNHAVVLSSRALLPDEHFEIRIDRVVSKWAGSIEIGVTLHDPLSLDFPSTLTGMPAGTWLMSSNGIMQDGEIIKEEYGQADDLRHLKVCVPLNKTFPPPCHR